jgi:MoaA/NifB/PqqE/SkfB family radical SAM enzyme
MKKTANQTIANGINIEITNKCKIKCPACPRQTNKKNLVGSYTIPLNELKLIIDTFPQLSFCGQMADPIYHPEFLDLVKYIDNDTNVTFHTNGHGFDEDWWWDVFVACKGKRIRWIFGLDGLPKDSHKYRVLQDGEQVFEMMQLGASLGCDIRWQYIVFNYNENDIEEARALAKKNNITFEEMHSNRFWANPEYKPNNKDKYVN